MAVEGEKALIDELNKFAEMMQCPVVFGNKVRRNHDECA